MVQVPPLNIISGIIGIQYILNSINNRDFFFFKQMLLINTIVLKKINY